MATVFATLFAHDAKAFDTRIDALARTVCPADPRTWTNAAPTRSAPWPTATTAWPASATPTTAPPVRTHPRPGWWST